MSVGQGSGCPVNVLNAAELCTDTVALVNPRLCMFHNKNTKKSALLPALLRWLIDETASLEGVTGCGLLHRVCQPVVIPFWWRASEIHSLMSRSPADESRCVAPGTALQLEVCTSDQQPPLPHPSPF